MTITFQIDTDNKMRETFVFNLQGRYTLLTKFKRYVRSTWMKNYENLSVFGLDGRTNNACESYHSRFNALVGRNHPEAKKFADFANEMLENYHGFYEIERTSK